MKRRVPGTTVVRSTHARSTPPTAAMQSTLNSLLTTHESITTSLSTLRTAASIHATRSSAVADRLGKPFRPSKVHIVRQLPKTRSGKVMRRLIRQSYCNETPGDLSSLDNPSALQEIGALSETSAS